MGAVSRRGKDTAGREAEAQTNGKVSETLEDTALTPRSLPSWLPTVETFLCAHV